MCVGENETVSYTSSECKMLALKEYKKRHGNVCRYIHEYTPQGYKHESDGVIKKKI